MSCRVLPSSTFLFFFVCSLVFVNGIFLKILKSRMFCVGVSSAFALMTRLDKLMVAAKEIVGEQYHIHGIGVRGERGYYGRSSHPGGASGGASGYGYGYGYGYGPNSQHGKGGSSVDMGRPHKDA